MCDLVGDLETYRAVAGFPLVLCKSNTSVIHSGGDKPDVGRVVMQTELDEDLPQHETGVDARRSWVTVVTGVIDRLPLPAAVCYIVLGLGAVCLFLLNDWIALGRPLEVGRPFHLILALEPIYALAVMHYLDVSAGRALHRMRVLIAPLDAYDELKQRLTVLPWRTTLQASGVGMLLGLGAVLLARLFASRRVSTLPGAGCRPWFCRGLAGADVVCFWRALLPHLAPTPDNQ